MWWQFWQSSGPTLVPTKVQKTLEYQFGLSSEAIAELRYVEKSGLYAGRRVKYVRIFDPSLNESKGVGKYEDLTTSKEYLLFEGHVEKKGSLIHLVDRRPPGRGTKTSKPATSDKK